MGKLTNNFRFLVICVFVILLTAVSFGWHGAGTHANLTVEAVNRSNLDSYLKERLYIIQGVDATPSYTLSASEQWRTVSTAEMPGIVTRTIPDWFRLGAVLEDSTLLRCRNHFHDPYHNRGLDNTRRTKLDVLYKGESAMRWAWSDFDDNHNTWDNARSAFYESLTNSESTVREQKFALTMFNLGHVLHLLEDMGVPAHARNDSLYAHVRGGSSGNPLENWVETRVNTNGVTQFLSGCEGPKALNRFSDYFDTELYNGVYAGSSPPSSWGLSEKTNYQFLSWSTMFLDIDPPTPYWEYSFPHPSVSYVSTTVDNNRRYLTGYNVGHLARAFTTDEFRNGEDKYRHLPYAVEGDLVLQDYADITLPRCVDYASGLVNYFFRGQLDVEVKPTSTNYISEITITNKSMTITDKANNIGIEQALLGGDLELYAYKNNGDLIKIKPGPEDPTWDNITLGYNESFTDTFVIESDTMFYRVVYRGQIVHNVSREEDPDDENAIACGRTITPKAVLYYMNCSSVYQQNSSGEYETDKGNFSAYYQAQEAQGQSVRVGLFYVPKPCCPATSTTGKIAYVIHAGSTFPDDFPEEIYYEELTVVPTARAEIDNNISHLLSGLRPWYLIIIHHDGETMFESYEAWTQWTSCQEYILPNYVYPGVDGGPSGILYDALYDYLDPWATKGYLVDAIFRLTDDDWLLNTQMKMGGLDPYVP